MAAGDAPPWSAATVDYQGQRRELAKARSAAFAEPPTGPNQVWQLDFSEYETTTGGIWRLAGCCDYYSTYEYGWHLAPGCTGLDAIEAVRLAIAEAEAIAGGVPLLQQLPLDPETGRPERVKIVTDNGARSQAPRSPRSSPPGPSSSTSAPAGAARARTACANGPSAH